MCAGVEVNAITESNNQIIFANTGDTFTPSSGVYSVSSGDNKTIQISEGVEYANFKGGISVASGGTLNFSFAGMDSLTGSGLITSQNFKFFDVTPTVNDKKQMLNNGSLNFSFSSSSLGDLQARYAILDNDSSDFQIINNNVMNFDIANSAVFELRPKTSNSGEMIFNIGQNSLLDLQFQTAALTNSGGKMIFNIGSLGNIQTRYGDYEEGIVSESGTTIFDLKDTYLSAISTNITNKSGATTVMNFDNTKTAQITSYKLISENDQKPEFIFNIKNNSSALLGASEMRNLKLDFQTSGNEVFFVTPLSAMTWLDNSSNSNNYVTLASFTSTHLLRDYLVYRNDFRVLEIGKKGDTTGVAGLSGDNLTFVVYANLDAKAQKIDSGDNWTPIYQDQKPVIDETKTKNPTLAGHPLQSDTYAYSDRVIIHSSQGNQGGVHNIGVVFSYWDYANLSSLSYKGGDVKTEGNIAIASVAKNSKVTLNPTSVTIGFNSVETSFEKVDTNDQGIIDTATPSNNIYTTYFLKSAQDTGVAPVTQEVTSSVFALNYDLFIANFNSLNKRMGDLRNNSYSQGAWGRIFNGQLSNDFGLGSASNYTTLQAGYDYDFSLSNAKNYLGVAFAYGFSISEMSSNASNALQNREIKDIFSNNIELALYNAYVEDSGLYSDSIAKFSYLISDFNLTNNGASEKLSVNNYAFQLSEEVGYVFSLGGNKEWSITPQAELSFGYYSDSDLTQVAGEFYLDAKAKSLMMLRARVGTMVGYDFKQFTQDKNFNASLYAGLSYEYDYLSGGDIELTPNYGKATTTKSALSSDGRGVVNLGTNISLKDDIRLYADFQSSFGGKINTDYQINIGARFSFGEKILSKIEG